MANRACLYARVSTEEQAEKYGLSSQLTELREMAADKGYTVVAEFHDDGYSGSDLARPALTKLRDALGLHTFDVVLVHDPDRLSRKLAHQMLLLDEIDKAGARVEFLTTPREDTPEGGLLLNVKAVIGEYERLKIKERTSRGRREKARKGLVVGGPAPYGYKFDVSSATLPTISPSSTSTDGRGSLPARDRGRRRHSGKLIVDETQAATVRMIYKWIVDEQRSLRSVAVELQRLGVPTPRGKTWSRSFLHKLLTDRRYIGTWVYNRREYTGQGRAFKVRDERDWITVPVPAIVDEGLFARAGEAMQRNRERMVGRPGVTFFLLRGLLRCGLCGRKLHGANWSEQRRHRRAYVCSGRDRLEGVGCRAGRSIADRIEARVWGTITGILRNPKLLTEKLEAHRTRLGAREVEVRSEAEHLTRQLAEVERQEARLLDLYVDESLQVPAVRTRLQAITQRKAGLQEQLARAQMQAAAREAEEARQDTIKLFCRRALRGLGKLTPEGCQQLLRALVDEIVVKDEALEIHGVLPGRGLPADACEKLSTSGRGHGQLPLPPRAYVLVIPDGRARA